MAGIPLPYSFEPRARPQVICVRHAGMPPRERNLQHRHSNYTLARLKSKQGGLDGVGLSTRHDPGYAMIRVLMFPLARGHYHRVSDEFLTAKQLQVLPYRHLCTG